MYALLRSGASHVNKHYGTPLFLQNRCTRCCSINWIMQKFRSSTQPLFNSIKDKYAVEEISATKPKEGLKSEISEQNKKYKLFRFPDEKTILMYLSSHPLLNIGYYQEKGITQAITELAAKRFALAENVEMGIQIGVALLINDLQSGEDGFTGKALPNLGDLKLASVVWVQISMATEKALLDCAKKFN